VSDTEWPEVTLGDHVNLLSGFAFKSKQFTDEPDDIPLVKGANVHQGFIDWETAKRWPTTELNGFEKYFLEPGDVVLAMDRPWIEAGLKWAWIRPEHPKSLLVQRVSRMRGLDDLDTRFLRYIIGSPQFTDYIRPIVTGVNVPHISGGQIKGFTFQLPPLPIQRKIASILSAYDDLIENNTRRIAILEEMAQAIYREWFVNFRFPGHENVKLVDSPLGQIPEGWEVVKFTDIANVLSGGTPKTKNSEYWNGDIPFFTPRDCPDGFFVLSTARSVTEKGVENCSSANFPERSIFITARGTVGKTVLTPCNMAMSQSCYAIKPKSLPQETTFLILRSSVEELKTRTHGAVFDTIIKDTFKQIQIALAPRSLASDFQERVQPFFDELLVLYMKNRNLRSTRDLLLPKLISGKLDVEDLDIDVGLTTEALEEATA